MSKSRIKTGLTIDDTLFLKGLALLLLLFHHLFYDCDTSYYYPWMINGVDITREIAKASRICVTIFVFLSGYGLSKSMIGKDVNWYTFFKRRFIKLFFNYWIIWIFFVPIGVFLFNRTFDVIYNSHVVLYFLIDLVGMAYNFQTPTYNATWWFYSCIIVLYIIFPFIYRYCKNSISCLIMCIVGLLVMHFVKAVQWYIVPFVLGVYLAKTHIINSIAVRLSHISNWLLIPLLGGVLLLLM